MHGKVPNQNAPSSRSKPNRLYANKNSEVSGFSRPQNERSHSQNKFAASVTRILQTWEAAEKRQAGAETSCRRRLYFSELCGWWCSGSIKWPPLVKLVHVAQYNAWEWCLRAASGMEWNLLLLVVLADGEGRRISPGAPFIGSSPAH